jgi:hypothetical protein
MLLFVLLDIGLSMAVELSRQQLQSTGSHLQHFKTEKETIFYEKRSTYFDGQTDFRVGKMRPLEDKALVRELESILKKVQTTDRFLKTKNLSFNDLTLDPLHRNHWILDGFRITDDSILYPELSAIFMKLQDKKWVLESGVEMSLDFKKYRVITKGRPGKFLPTPERNCQQISGATQCKFDSHGVIYVR